MRLTGDEEPASAARTTVETAAKILHATKKVVGKGPYNPFCGIHATVQYRLFRVEWYPVYLHRGPVEFLLITPAACGAGLSIATLTSWHDLGNLLFF